MRKYLIIIAILAVFELVCSTYLVTWRHNFWDAVSLKHGIEMAYQLGIFTVLALSLCITTAYSGYCMTLAGIAWRNDLTGCAVRHDLIDGNGKVRGDIENLSQRIQSDLIEYPQLFLSLSIGMSKALVYIAVFAIMLCTQFSFYYLLILVGYTIISTWVAKRLASPLIQLNYDSQRAEATYRNDLSNINFSICISIMLGLAKQTKKLNYFQVLFSQCSVIIPICIFIPVYFSTNATLGVLMAVTSLMGTLLDNMSYPINTYDSINRLLSSRRRLKEIEII